MKIVTAGHRGSVATGDEIRGTRNNRRRIFSYYLIILFSICALGAAQGAKLCGLKPIYSTTADQKLGVACNLSAGFYVYGRNCGGTYKEHIGWPESPAHMYVNNGKTDMAWTGWCDEILAVAVSAKGADGFWDVIYLYPYYRNSGQSTNDETEVLSYHASWACYYMALHA